MNTDFKLSQLPNSYVSYEMCWFFILQQEKNILKEHNYLNKKLRNTA